VLALLELVVESDVEGAVGVDDVDSSRSNVSVDFVFAFEVDLDDDDDEEDEEEVALLDRATETVGEEGRRYSGGE